MSDALKILDERLAKGEITEEEYERLSARLKSSQSEMATPKPKEWTAKTPLEEPDEKGGLDAGTIRAIMIGVVAVLGVSIYNYSNEYSSTEKICNKKITTQNRSAVCSCVAEESRSRISKLSFLPIVGRLIFSPSEGALNSLLSDSIKICLRRF